MHPLECMGELGKVDDINFAGEFTWYSLAFS
jgi:hypothetical protein